jgi:uncharacterized protein with HEPN domain
MPRDYKVYLEDIREAISRIRLFTGRISFGEFEADIKTTDAVVRNLMIVGEAVKSVPDEIRSAHPEIAWKEFAGLRDILIHRYFGIDQEILWDIIQTKLPVLDQQVRELLAE